ncbi:MAG: type II secretion system protein GspG [Candidatus Omnitrophica bacterium]|nr:type II secretion system protein GspG [Candidatus Omnitrophota bacterium]
MKHKGFTLIELLVVMAIIAVLAGLVSSAAQVARKRGTITKAKAAIAALETSLSMYEVDIGDFPEGDIVDVVTSLSDPTGSVEWNGPYMKFTRDELSSDGEYLDPWGNPYVYTYPGKENVFSYDLYSRGPNGKGDGNDSDDITNW